MKRKPASKDAAGAADPSKKDEAKASAETKQRQPTDEDSAEAPNPKQGSAQGTAESEPAAQRPAHRRDGPAEAARDHRSRQPLAAQSLDLGLGSAIKPGRA
ncbi:hypothetical protein ACH196_37930, partial [Mesorhizobium sp. IMUNJ23232]